MFDSKVTVPKEQRDPQCLSKGVVVPIEFEDSLEGLENGVILGPKIPVVFSDLDIYEVSVLRGVLTKEQAELVRATDSFYDESVKRGFITRLQANAIKGRT